MPGSKKDAFAPDLPDFPTSCIRPADELIDEATQRLAAIERALAALQRRRRRWSTLAPNARKELREQIDYLQARREIAELELVELIELAELPVEWMGSA